jgi:asparagine synthase (glutamine-hydrolysing)
MCGLCGIAYERESDRVDRDVIRRMTAAIVHRGPDDDGYYVGGGVGLGMRRLAIIDLRGGKQPIANEDGTVQLVHNGEIYNYRELRCELERSGHRFSTRSDSEVIVHAYEEHGDACLQRLRGMLGLAIWDVRQRRLLLAVDRFGIKPLYYASHSKGIVFGSELKCILASGLVARDIDLDALAEYFTLGYIAPPATIFAGVRKLGPGSLLRWSAGSAIDLHQYWDVPRSVSELEHTGSDTREALRAALLDTVRAHLASDVPVGAFLSGGIDSSVVVALMSEAMSEPVRTFSIGFADPRYSELDKARAVARRYGTEHHELIVEPEAIDVLPSIVAHFDEPFADSSALPTYHLSKLARRHVKAVLSGDGGDEVFLGYTLFRGLELSRHAQALPKRLRRVAAGLAEHHLPLTQSAPHNDRLALLGKRLTDTMVPPDVAFTRKLSAPGLDVIRPFLSAELRGSLDTRDPFATVHGWLERYSRSTKGHPLERFVRTGFQTSLPGDMLVKVDRMSMAHSLEVRVPFLDYLLVEHVARIPMSRLVPRWQLKGLLKETMAHELPREVRRAPKRGFTVPVAAWFRGNLAEYAREVLVSLDTRQRGFLDTPSVERMLARHRDGEQNSGAAIWTLLMFELWCRWALD